MSDSREIERDNVWLEPFFLAIVSAIEEAVPEHFPKAKIHLMHCGGCDGLHGHVVTEGEDDDIEHFSFFVPPGAWREVVRN